ncbi:MAG: hypothetical protein WBD79_10165 [Anaerolineae bacterium]
MEIASEFDNLAVSEVVKYYEAGGQRVAMRKNGAVSYLLGTTWAAPA